LRSSARWCGQPLVQGKPLLDRIGQIREQHVGFDGITLKIIHRIANIFRDDAKT
jgi:hypothetical protein